jgi:murein DD-endopeptidase MepM/ murein hydrolase activator NlpD
LATLHHDLPTARPSSPTWRRRRLRAVHGALLAAALLTGGLTTAPGAAAAPGDSAQSVYEALEGQVAELEARVTEAQETLQRMTVEAEHASGEALAAQAALDAARETADAAAAELAAARADVGEAEGRIAELGREAYMGGATDTFGDIGLLLDASSPEELLQQAATLELLGDHRAAQLVEFQAQEAREARAERAARDAVAEQDRLATAAGEAAAAAEAHLAEAQGTFDAVTAEKTALDEQLREASVRLLSAQGVRDPDAAFAASRAARDGAMLSAAAGAIAPAQGRVTSCYGQRWGTLHAGVDIAAPIGTPIYAPEGGVVLDAGPASGFGLAVYLQHGDGSITLYGHVNQFFVHAGQVVSAGQQIAEVGNRGQSTGPHLHFEVHEGGLYKNRVNPMPWLSARGISLGGGC